MNPTLLSVLIMNIKSSIGAVLIIILAFLAPIAQLIVLVAFAIAVDTLFGIVRSYKKKRAITSRRLSALISKLFLYEFAVIGMFIVDKFLIGELITMFTAIPLVLTKLVVSTLISIELKSINENVESGFNINLWNEFKKMVSRAKTVKDDIDELDLTDNKEDKEEE